MKQPPDILSLLAGRRFWLVIVLLWACAYLPGLGARDLRLEEGRRATPAREMLTTGDYLTPRIYGDVYLNKPPGYFWLVAGVGYLNGGVDAWATRIPSAISVLLSALIALGFAKRDLSRQARGLAALMILSVPAMLDKGTLGEIDATLSMLVFAAMCVFYNAYAAARDAASPRWSTMFWSWVAVGALSGVMVLLKGPGGPLELGAPIVCFLLWERQWRMLFSPGVLVGILLAVAPAGVWVWLLLESQAPHKLAQIWSNQLGLDTAARAAKTGVDDDNVSLIGRYLWHFPRDIIGMTLPWAIWAGIALVPQQARKTRIRPRLYRFLVCSIVAMVLPFYLWPASHGRHVMAIVYGVCILAAAFLMGDPGRAHPPWSKRLLAFMSLLLAAAPMAAGVAAVGLALRYYHAGLATASLLLIAGALGSGILTRLVQRVAVAPATVGVAFAATLAIAIISGRAVASSILLPMKAASDETRLAAIEIAKLIPPGSEVYTLETFGRDGAGSYYNIQFYAGTQALGHTLRALHNADELPAGRQVLVLGTAPEIAALANTEKTLVGVIPTKEKKLSPLQVVRVRRQ